MRVDTAGFTLLASRTSVTSWRGVSAGTEEGQQRAWGRHLVGGNGDQARAGAAFPDAEEESHNKVAWYELGGGCT